MHISNVFPKNCIYIALELMDIPESPGTSTAMQWFYQKWLQVMELRQGQTRWNLDATGSK